MTLARQLDRPADPEKTYWLVCHGGLGDICWVNKKQFPLPLHISISNENRSRPRRAGILAEHLPQVVSYNFANTAFTPEGNDWPPSDDPCCAIGKKFSELDIHPGVPFRIECNRWLEGGRRIEDWLPDLPTEHHFEFRPCGPADLTLRSPCIVLHLAGWPDVPDNVWVAAADLFRTVGHVYIVGGSYDFRPRRVYELCHRGSAGVTLIEDTSWGSLMGLLKSCTYCFGHASGLTALADILKVPGAVFNPRVVPRLVGTWNSLDNPAQVHVDRVDRFEQAMATAYEAIRSGNKSTWPPSIVQGPRLMAERLNDRSIAYNAAKVAGASGPRNVLVWGVDVATPQELAAAVLDGAYSCGKIVKKLDMVGFHADGLSQVFRESMRSTSRPKIDVQDFFSHPDDFETYDLAVLYVTSRFAEAADQVRRVWAAMSMSGTLLVGGQAAATAVESLASSLHVTPAEVENCAGWFYLHRRL